VVFLPYGGGYQEPLYGVAPPYVVVSGSITRSKRTKVQVEETSTQQQMSKQNRPHDLDHDDRTPEEDPEEEKDITLVQNVRPPPYFPPVDLETWDGHELRKLQITDTFSFSKMKDFTMSGQVEIWGENRTNLSLFRQRVPSNAISEFVMNSNVILCHKARGGPPCVVVHESSIRVSSPPWNITVRPQKAARGHPIHPYTLLVERNEPRC
jgi:hypothetical protein